MIAEEGCFKLSSVDRKTQIVVRKVKLDEKGNTILECEQDDLHGTGFQPGQKVFLYRRYAYGNLHDSDNEPSTYKFSDNSYGSRVGLPYPLQNWCVIFEHLEIQNKK